MKANFIFNTCGRKNKEIYELYTNIIGLFVTVCATYQ